MSVYSEQDLFKHRTERIEAKYSDLAQTKNTVTAQQRSLRSLSDKEKEQLEEFCARHYIEGKLMFCMYPVVSIYERKKSPFCKDASLSESHGDMIECPFQFL
ncbi:hypothetical protein LEMLEM_LOCUS25478 [Lemmus lemmus]